MNLTSFRPSFNISFALFSITDVTSVSEGPPFGVLYLNPPSHGGLCDGVMITPSFKSFEFLFDSIIVKDITGVGVYVFLAAILH